MCVHISDQDHVQERPLWVISIPFMEDCLEEDQSAVWSSGDCAVCMQMSEWSVGMWFCRSWFFCRSQELSRWNKG